MLFFRLSFLLKLKWLLNTLFLSILYLFIYVLKWKRKKVFPPAVTFSAFDWCPISQRVSDVCGVKLFNATFRAHLITIPSYTVSVTIYIENCHYYFVLLFLKLSLFVSSLMLQFNNVKKLLRVPIPAPWVFSL